MCQAEGILAMWRVRKEEFTGKTIDTVVQCALHLRAIVNDFGDGWKFLKKS